MDQCNSGAARHLDDLLRTCVAAGENAGCLLDAGVYAATCALFMACVDDPAQMVRLRHLVPHYGTLEFAPSVDRAGVPVEPSAALLADFQAIASHSPEFSAWFRPATAGTGSQVLLPARWLSHVLGLRHRTVEIFIDHPAVSDYTLVQVRAGGKREYPAAFDVPAAGHVVGLQTVQESLLKELAEELSLNASDLDDVRQIGAYEYGWADETRAHRDLEWRSVFHGRLKPGRIEVVRFADGEVAAICLFALTDLQAMAHEYPERFASGLAQSLPLYLQTRRDVKDEGRTAAA